MTLIQTLRLSRRATPPEPRTAAVPGRRSTRVAFAACGALGAAARGVRRVAWRLRGRQGRPPLRILVARRVRLGDLVVSLPLLDALRAAHPDARITLATTAAEPVRSLLGDDPRGLDARVLDPAQGRLARARTLLALAAGGYDVALCGERFALIRDAFFCGAARCVGFDDDHPLRALCTTRTAFDPKRHAAENLLALGSAAGLLDGARPAPAPRLRARDPDVRSALRERLDIPPGSRQIVLHPGAQKASRRWPVERFAALGAALLAADPRRFLLVTGGPDERSVAAAVCDALPAEARERSVCAAGRTDLRELVDVLADAALAVCNDTGVMHLARAAGAPLLALLGPENPDVWGPHPEGAAPALALRHRVPCAPCKRMRCESLFCLRALSVVEAQQAAEALLAEDRPTRLERREHIHDWGTLHASGFALPQVVLLASDPAWLGDTPPHAAVGYPVRRAAPADAEAPPGAAFVARVDGPPTPGVARAIGDAVARLVREPELGAVALGDGDPVAPDAPRRTGVLYRADAWSAARATEAVHG